MRRKHGRHGGYLLTAVALAAHRTHCPEDTLKLNRSALVALLAVATTLVAGAGTAQALVWTPLDSTTTEEIATVEYHPDGRIWFATTNGKIYRRAAGGPFTLEGSFPGRQFSDIAFDPSGTVGLATADSGSLYRSVDGGDSWGLVLLTNTSFDHTCPSSGGPYAAMTPTANLLAIGWSSASTVYVVSAARGQVLRSTSSGQPGTWSDASRQSNGDCRINANVTDVAPIPGSATDLYFVDDSFGGLWRTADGLASFAADRGDVVNCFDVGMRVAVDPASPNRVAAAGVCTGTLHWGFSSDGGTTSEYVHSLSSARVRDLGAGPGVFIAVGDAGLVEQSFGGTDASAQPAGGALATRDWRAVDFADASHAAIAGVGGALAITDQANVPPTSGGGTTPPPDTTVPTIGGGVAIGDRTLIPGQGTSFGFNASEAGLAVLTFEKRFDGLKGKRKGRRVCLSKTKKRLGALRKQAGSGGRAYRRLLAKQACRGYQRVGQIRKQVQPGSNAIAFNGRIAGRKLSRGAYRAKLVVTDSAGNKSRTETVRFTVAPKRRR
jgi:hypothetical protein